VKGYATLPGSARTFAFALVVALAAAGFVASGVSRDPEPSDGPEGSTSGARQLPHETFASGWTRLSPPPRLRQDSTLLWAGSELLLWGGCGSHDCPSVSGYAFDLAARKWERIPDAPQAAEYSEAVWTGDEAIFVMVGPRGPARGVAYDPGRDTWRTLPPAPTTARFGATLVWTGDEAILWGGGPRGASANVRGAAYDPENDSWRRIQDSPFGLNLASGMWTGREMLVFGSLLDRGNSAPTRTSVGLAYDPAGDSWRRLPRSSLSPQATSAVWVAERMVAWDYELRSQTYDPDGNRWTERIRMPLEFFECYPDSVAVAGRAFVFFCGTAALYEPESRSWLRLRTGPFSPTAGPNAPRYGLWCCGELAGAHEVMFFLVEDCAECSRSRQSFWAYRPQ
jgi:hypothetical protein